MILLSILLFAPHLAVAGPPPTAPVSELNRVIATDAPSSVSAEESSLPGSDSTPQPTLQKIQNQPVGTQTIGAQSRRAAAYIPVGEAKTKKVLIAIAPVATLGSGLAPTLGQTLRKTIVNDLNYMDMFNFLPERLYKIDASSPGLQINPLFGFDQWKIPGTEIIIKTALTVEPRKKLRLQLAIYNVAAKSQMLLKDFHAQASEIEFLGHLAANEIIQTLTHQPGIFLTKIAMSCEVGKYKELYIMNFDGSDAKRVTYHRSIAFAPAWSPDGTRLAYSLFTRKKIKNIDLYEFDFTSNSIRPLSRRRGINSGAAYSPDGDFVTATLSFSGNPALYSISRKTGGITRLTKSFGFDVDPAWSPDGSKIAFASSRVGKPMIFTMNSNGSHVQRITYAGHYNASPSWAPSGKKLVFAGWLNSGFDIFTMNDNGSHIERLTKNQGNNEDPYYSPDGNFVVFSSNRAGKKNIYVMNTDGSFVKRLTYGLGHCVTPKWSSPPLVGISDVQQ